MLPSKLFPFNVFFEHLFAIIRYKENRAKRPHKTADRIINPGVELAAIEKLDKQTNVVTVIEVFSAYNRWLISRMELDPELTPELVKTMNRYQDIFIGEQLNSTKIESK